LAPQNLIRCNWEKPLMSHIPDMKAVGGRMVAVGWLHPTHPYPRGTAPTEFVTRLAEFARNWGNSIDALNWGAAGGFHECEFCTKPLPSRRFGNDLASGTFGVPAGDRIFYCPEMISHYVVEHGYLPPAEFVSAVVACPVPGTPEYAAAAEPFANRFG
jgi:hypothetical protein